MYLGVLFSSLRESIQLGKIGSRKLRRHFCLRNSLLSHSFETSDSRGADGGGPSLPRCFWVANNSMSGTGSVAKLRSFAAHQLPHSPICFRVNFENFLGLQGEFHPLASHTAFLCQHWIVLVSIWPVIFTCTKSCQLLQNSSPLIPTFLILCQCSRLFSLPSTTLWSFSGIWEGRGIKHVNSNCHLQVLLVCLVSIFISEITKMYFRDRIILQRVNIFFSMVKKRCYLSLDTLRCYCQSWLHINVFWWGGGWQNANVYVTFPKVFDRPGMGPAVSFHKTSLGSLGTESADNSGS